ncbi:MAG: hypothetical protein ACE5LG_02300 [Anaerolineae bacterium]
MEEKIFFHEEVEYIHPIVFNSPTLSRLAPGEVLRYNGINLGR